MERRLNSFASLPGARVNGSGGISGRSWCVCSVHGSFSYTAVSGLPKPEAGRLDACRLHLLIPLVRVRVFAGCESEYGCALYRLLTYMATISTLAGPNGPLTSITVPLRVGVQPERSFYALGGFVHWVVNTLPGLATGRLQAAQTPRQQLDSVLRTWMIGRPMRYPEVMNDLSPMAMEVWELKTPDLRIFGWIYRPKVFIAVLGDYADDYKPPTKTKNYADARNSVVAARDALDIDPPKFTAGEFDALV